MWIETSGKLIRIKRYDVIYKKDDKTIFFYCTGKTDYWVNYPDTETRDSEFKRISDLLLKIKPATNKSSEAI